MRGAIVLLAGLAFTGAAHAASYAWSLGDGSTAEGPVVDGVYGHDSFEAVLAFQKVHGLARTGRVEPWLWRRLSLASVPRAHLGATVVVHL